jgi:NAD(P)-dependent dehydrogenase (short-subunit alcohol dehydrogenase family)
MNSEYFASEKGLKYIKKMPARRLGQLSELNGPLLLLCSDAGSFINGVALPVDGGHMVKSL